MEEDFWEAQEQAAYEAEMRAREEEYYQAVYEDFWMSLMKENEAITESF